MKTIARSLIAAALLLAVACNTVHSTEPVGTEVLTLEPESWDGAWLMGSGSTCTLRVLDGEAGHLEVAVVSEDNGQLVARVFQVRLREHGGWTFASIEDPDRPGLHLWLRIQRDEEQVILWIPDPEEIARLVQGGALAGRVDEHDNVVLESLDEEQLKTLHAGLDARLFEWEQPFAMIRLSRAVK